MRNTLVMANALFASLLLAACGGGSTEEPAPMAQEPTEVPASASVSTTAFVNYAGTLASSETKEPLDITKAMPPTSETDEPLPI